MAQRDGEPENAAELEFGKDLNNCECLSTSEVAEFFSKNEPGPREKSDSLKTREYVNRVRQFKGMQDNYAARETLRHLGLAQFEIAQILNLCPENLEEAEALLPSLRLADRSELKGEGVGPVNMDKLSDALVKMEEYRAIS